MLVTQVEEIIVYLFKYSLKFYEKLAFVSVVDQKGHNIEVSLDLTVDRG